MSRLAAVMIALVAIASRAIAQDAGPSTTTLPYLVANPSLPAGAVRITSILTVGDAVGGYRMVGIPDGLGAWASDDGDGDGDDGEEHGALELLMNHELAAGAGTVRAHGSAGAFVSRWSVDPSTLEVLSGRDHATAPAEVHLYDRSTGTWAPGTTAFDRLCSADLAPTSAFRFGRFGTSRRILLNGEETRPPSAPDHGRAFAHVATGRGRDESWELPALGRMSFENVVASPHRQLRTIVMGLDDADVRTDPALTPAPSELYVYVGTKQDRGSDVVRAGLTGGTLYGVQLVAADGSVIPAESDAFGFGATAFAGAARFRLVSLGDVSPLSGNELQARSIAGGVTRFQRIEDGAWDPRRGFEDDFYFDTTATFATNSRLHRLRFDDVEEPERGGTIEIVLAGDEGHRMIDNLTVDPLGRVVMVEDVGNNPRLGKVWLYDLTNGNLVEVAAADPARFLAGAPGFLTQDEEASGVIPVFDLLGPGWYLIDVQAHHRIDGELVEGGQLLAIYVDPELGR